jgi:hypothetical protein
MTSHPLLKLNACDTIDVGAVKGSGHLVVWILSTVCSVEMYILDIN